MKTRSKFILLSTLALAASAADATVLFQRGFEGGSTNSFFNNGDEGFSVSNFGNVSFHNTFQYRDSQPGVSPAEGARMLEWHPASVQSGRTFYHAGLGSELYKVRGQHRFMQASIKFWVGSGDLDDKELEMFPDIFGSSGNYYTFLNLRTGNWRTLTGVTFGDRSGTANLKHDAWNTLAMTHDFESWRMRVTLNGTTLAETESGYLGGNDGYISHLKITLAQKSDASSIYDPTVGGPRMYLDDYRVDAVPEPSSWLVLLAGSLLLQKSTSRRKSVEGTS